MREDLLDSEIENNLEKKIIEVVDVSLRLNRDQDYFEVLDSVDFYARQGEVVSVIGPSGCGKSTFLDILSGL